MSMGGVLIVFSTSDTSCVRFSGVLGCVYELAEGMEDIEMVQCAVFGGRSIVAGGVVCLPADITVAPVAAGSALL